MRENLKLDRKTCKNILVTSKEVSWRSIEVGPHIALRAGVAMVAVVPRVEMGEQFEGPEVIAMRMHLVLPNGRKKEMWDFLILVFVLYNALMVPFGLAFYDFFNLDVSLIGFVCDSSIDALFIIDLFIAFRTTYYDFYGNLVLDRRKVMVHYVRSWFLPDLIASIPYEQIALLIALLAGVTIGSITGLLKLMKLAKLLRLTRLAKKLERIAAAKTFRVLQFVLMLLTFAHWYACLWFWMGSSKPPDEGEAINPLPGMNGTSWIFRTQMEDEHFMMQYLASFYWALSMVMKSPWFHPVAPGEFAFASVMMIFGCVLFAYFLGNVTAVITAANASSGKYRDQIGQSTRPYRSPPCIHSSPLDPDRIPHHLARCRVLTQYAAFASRTGSADRQRRNCLRTPTRCGPSGVAASTVARCSRRFRRTCCQR